ncbi:MAG: LysR family transcriptional regulator [Acidimicrobiales bacterium]
MRSGTEGEQTGGRGATAPVGGRLVPGRFVSTGRWPSAESLDLLVSVARMGSLSRAARAHGMSQPSASSRLAGLEIELGLTLLERGPTGSHPTTEGWRVIELAGEALDALDGLMAGVASMQAEAAGRLRLVASYTIGEYLLPQWLGRFHRRHPRLEVELEVVNSRRVLDRLRDGHSDLGFVESPELPGDMRSWQVALDELVIVVTPRHPWARRRRPVSVGELIETPVVLREHGSGTREAYEQALVAAGAGTRPVAVLELGSTSALKSAVIGGLGPGVLSHLAVIHELETGSLVGVAVEGIDLRRSLCAVWPTGRGAGVLARSFLTSLGTGESGVLPPA